MQRPLAITCGDPSGVGPDIIARWISTHKERALDSVIIGPAEWLSTLPIWAQRRVSVGPNSFRLTPGKPGVTGARVALEAMSLAAEGCRTGEFSGVVTGPVSKEWSAKVDPKFIGQTEFFARKWGGKPSMCFAGGRLKLALATWHIPLRKVSGALNREVIERSVFAAEILARADGCRTPRIGFCGLNPHAGEAGILGREEIEIINPVLRRLRRKIEGLSLSLPGDTLFARALKGEFDVVVALYHDQGLAPLKAVDFDEAVNITLGLPFVRTSPDHGTAYELAGKGTASARSFGNAVTWADRLIAARAKE